MNYNAGLDAVYIYNAIGVRSDHHSSIDDEGRIIIDYDKNNNPIGLMIDYVSEPELAYNALEEKKAEIPNALFELAIHYLKEKIMINVLEK